LRLRGRRSERGEAAASRDERRGRKENPWHRRHAIQLAAQLPEGRGDALLVLDAARRLVALGFLERGFCPEAGDRRRDPERRMLLI
jgi:hypothetical protein